MSDGLDIMVDIDDVICPTIDTIHEIAFEHGFHAGDVEPSWSGWEAYGCTPQAYWDLWTIFAQRGGYVTTPPIPGAVEALRRLMWEGHRIHLVTARGFMNHAEDIRRWTPLWVEEFAVPHHTLTFARDKVEAMSDIFGAGPGTGSFDQFDYAIDDSPKNVAALRDAGVEAYLLTHAHNRAHEGLPRIDSVGAFVDLILEAS